MNGGDSGWKEVAFWLAGLLQGVWGWIFYRTTAKIDELEKDARATRHTLRNEIAVGDADLDARIDPLEKDKVARDAKGKR